MRIIDDLERKLDQLMKEPSNPLLFNQIGVLLYQIKDWKNSEKYLHKAYQLDPRNYDILYNYASLLYLQCKYQETIPILQAYLEDNRSDEAAIKKMGDCYYLMGYYNSAGKLYKELQKY